MSIDDAVLAHALLVRHGWEAHRYCDKRGDGLWHVTASWPPMQIAAHEMGAPDAAWYSIHTPRQAVRAVCIYSAIKREEEAA